MFVNSVSTVVILPILFFVLTITLLKQPSKNDQIRVVFF